MPFSTRAEGRAGLGRVGQDGRAGQVRLMYTRNDRSDKGMCHGRAKRLQGETEYDMTRPCARPVSKQKPGYPGLAGM